MVSTSPRMRTYHLLAALVSTAIFLRLVRLFPSLKTANNPLVIVRCILEAVAAVAILFALTRADSQPLEAFGIRKVRAATFGWGFLCFLVSAILSALTLFAFCRFGIVQDKATLMALASRPAPIILLTDAAGLLSAAAAVAHHG